VRNVQITELRKNLRQVVKEVAETRRPVVVRRRTKQLVAIVPPPLEGRGGKPDIPLGALDEFAVRHELRGVYLFGSILSSRFHEGSDVDVMIDTGARMPSYFDTCRMAEELEAMFGRPVDLVIKSTIERDKNPHRRAAVLDHARLLVDRSAT
jgi:predicted nucleotidyltransferase